MFSDYFSPKSKELRFLVKLWQEYMRLHKNYRINYGTESNKQTHTGGDRPNTALSCWDGGLRSGRGSPFQQLQRAAGCPAGVAERPLLPLSGTGVVPSA